MITRVNGPQVWQRWKEAKRLALLAIFEDSVTGMRVKEFCQGLSRNLGEQCQIVEHVWLFNTLRLRELQEIAAEEGRERGEEARVFDRILEADSALRELPPDHAGHRPEVEEVQDEKHRAAAPHGHPRRGSDVGRDDQLRPGGLDQRSARLSL